MRRDRGDSGSVQAAEAHEGALETLEGCVGIVEAPGLEEVPSDPVGGRESGGR